MSRHLPDSEDGKKQGEGRNLHCRLMFFLGSKKHGVKWEKEHPDDLPQSKTKRFRSDDEAERKGKKEKKRKHEQENKDVSDVSLIHVIVNKDYRRRGIIFPLFAITTCA